jgi:hypothetical protein
VALTQQDLRWMTTDEILQAFRAGAVKPETFVYRAGMPTWVTLMEVGEIARALSDAGLAAPGSFGTAGAPIDAPDQRPSSPPPRPSSLPPPRKATRNRGTAALPQDAAPDEGAESDESLPFQLVSGRTNGGKKTAESPVPWAAAAVGDAALLPSAALEDDAAVATPLVPASGEAWASNDTSAPVNAGTNAAHDAGPAAAAAATPSLEVPPTNSAAPESGGALWIWLLLGLLLVVGAALFFGPRFGLRLP